MYVFGGLGDASDANGAEYCIISITQGSDEYLNGLPTRCRGQEAGDRLILGSLMCHGVAFHHGPTVDVQ